MEQQQMHPVVKMLAVFQLFGR